MGHPDATRERAGGSRLSFGFGCGAGVFVVGALIALLFAWGLHKDLAIDRDGREVDGIVLGVRGTGTKVMGRTVSDIKFRYTPDAETGPLEGTSSTSDRDVLKRLEPGERVRVEVARGNPRWARIQGTTVCEAGYAGAATLIFPLIGLVLMGRAAARAAFARSSRPGPPATAPRPPTAVEPPPETSREALPEPAPVGTTSSRKHGDIAAIARVVGCLFPAQHGSQWVIRSLST
jgi:hypothetical protein